MKQWLKIIGAVFFGTITLLLTKIAVRRLTWTYEENGHFDEATSTNYSDYGGLYGLLAVIFLIPTLVLLMSWIKTFKRGRL
ncbi:hypothetical protein [Chryseolinea soli]|uniref:Uncharacterized protein n=1 Tax=Chryseolinea soli TaxID=2321403 RepID=A0A385STM2_9BACT|nr:hypothetical protein [Chryseolinea soli]AYB33325.1 hypothetical protein D4L85_23260 [Chryseolinea soli]